MRVSLAALLVVAAVSAVFVGQAWTAPKPSEVPTSWQLDLYVPDTLRPIQVKVSDKEPARTYWYLRYTVTNKTGRDQIFAPDFTLYTNTGQVVTAGQTPAAVFEEIKKLYNDPLLLDVTGLTGRMLQGEDNAKNGVAIFNDFDADAGSVDVFISGLSGETAELKLPEPVQVTETDVRTGKPKTVTKDTILLSKTLQLPFQVPGEASSRMGAPAKMGKQTWVMR